MKLMAKLWRQKYFKKNVQCSIHPCKQKSSFMRTSREIEIHFRAIVSLPEGFNGDTSKRVIATVVVDDDLLLLEQPEN